MRIVSVILVVSALLLSSVACYGDELAGTIIPENKYETKSIGLYKEYLLDDVYFYASRGYFENNNADRVNILTGETQKVLPSLPSHVFEAIAVSDKYLLAEDGVYNRYSVYKKDNWQKTGTIRLKHPVLKSRIEGDVLYILQQTSSFQISLAMFSLPELKMIKENIVYTSEIPIDLSYEKKEIRFYKDLIVFHYVQNFYQGCKDNCGRIRLLDYEGNIQKEIGYNDVKPVFDGVRCGQGFQSLMPSVMLFRRECGLYAVFDLDKFEFLYDINLDEGNKFISFAFVDKEKIYAFVEYAKGGINDGVSYNLAVFDFLSGARIGGGFSFFGDHLRLYRVRDKIVATSYEENKMGHQVSVYNISSMDGE